MAGKLGVVSLVTQKFSCIFRMLKNQVGYHNRTQVHKINNLINKNNSY